MARRRQVAPGVGLRRFVRDVFGVVMDDDQRVPLHDDLNRDMRRDELVVKSGDGERPGSIARSDDLYSDGS